jgi:SAM-dependent methyltransferase
MSGAPDIVKAEAEHWSAFTDSLTPGASILDLGCGAGAAARALVGARRDVYVTGIDFARVPRMLHDQAELLSDTEMEALPFAEGSFRAAVSQFGFEYSQTNKTVRELARVLVADAKISFLVHHAESSIVAAGRARLNALAAFLGAKTRAAFCAGEAAAFNARMSALKELHPTDALVSELARSLPLWTDRARAERLVIWRAMEEALAPERCILEALDARCVAPEALEDWVSPLRVFFDLRPASVLHGLDGRPLAWRVEGARRGGHPYKSKPGSRG